MVYDVGAEEGEFGALAAMAGGVVHLIEPTPQVWPNMRAIWGANEIIPAGCWQGFFADVGRVRDGAKPTRDWPVCSRGEILHESYFAVVDERPDIPSITMDAYAAAVGARPDVIMMDIEGAETLALSGGTSCLEHCRILFVSVHPDGFMSRFGNNQESLFRLMNQRGFRSTWLAYDHESHWLFER